MQVVISIADVILNQSYLRIFKMSPEQVDKELKRRGSIITKPLAQILAVFVFIGWMKRDTASSLLAKTLK